MQTFCSWCCPRFDSLKSLLQFNFNIKQVPVKSDWFCASYLVELIYNIGANCN